MNKTQAKQLILGLSGGSSLDALVSTLVFRDKIFPLFYWDLSVKAGRYYPFSPDRFQLMMFSSVTHIPPRINEMAPLHLNTFSTSLNSSIPLIQKMKISLKALKKGSTPLWQASVGRLKVTNESPSVAVCQLTLLKALEL